MPYFKTLFASILLAAPALAVPFPSHVPLTAEIVKPVPVYTPFASPEPLVDPVVPAKTPRPHGKVSPSHFIGNESPEPIVDPIFTPPIESPEPVVDPVFPIESPDPVVDPVFPVESPEPVVDPVYPVESPEPVVDPVYTPVESPVPEEDIYVPEDGDEEYDDEEYDEDDREVPTPVYTPPPVKKDVEKKDFKGEKGHCYLQSVDFGKYTAEQCCEVRFSCDSPHCANNYACKHNPDMCHCHKTICKKIYLLASYKPVHKIRPSCSDDVFALH